MTDYRAKKLKAIIKKVARKNKWTEDMWDDYLNASEEMQRRMLQDWGEPE